MSVNVRPRIRLRDKLLISVTVLVIVLVCAVLYTLNERLQGSASEAINANLANTLNIFNRLVDERRSSLSAKAVLIADDSHLKAAIDVAKPNVATTTGINAARGERKTISRMRNATGSAINSPERSDSVEAIFRS